MRYNNFMKKNCVINIENADVYLKRNKILNNINLKIKKGEKCFILGANGAGKTTLIKTILGYIFPKYGAKVEVFGQEFGKTDLNEVRKSIAWISPFLTETFEFGMTGTNVVLSGLEGFLGFYRKASKDELQIVEKLLASLNALHLANKNIKEMSSGEQMKIMIARALISKPKLMILDEPNVFLDIKEKESLLKTIEKIALKNPDLTMIFISQRIEDILPIFDYGIILKNGEIHSKGIRHEILTEENLNKIFDLNIKLTQTKNGRLWCIIE